MKIVTEGGKEIHLRRAVAGDLVGLDFQGDKINDSMIILVSRLTGLTVEEVKQMDLRQYNKLVNEINEMFDL